MFRTAATKLAHNSTLPALGTNKDLRPLQDLITAEKAVLQSYQRISSDLLRSGEYLRHWGAGEGEDLQDILAACTALIGSLASAFSQYARHEQTIREYMKAVRSQEEYLDELRKRRKNVTSKADAAERKLSKMAPEHKNVLAQTDLLNGLREQIRELDWEILSQEAKLGDLKRTNTKHWMALKFGGLLECAEKATIVSDIGKLLIEEIPLTSTQPGQARAYYNGHEKTQSLLSEAQRCLSEVVFDPQPVSPTSDPGQTLAPFSNASVTSNLENRRSDSSLQRNTVSGMGADEFGGLEDNYGPRAYGSMPLADVSKLASDGLRYDFSEHRTSGHNSSVPVSSASRFGTFPIRKSSLSVEVLTPQPLPVSQDIALQPLQETASTSFADEVANALAYGKQGNMGSASFHRDDSIRPSLPSYRRYELDAPIPRAELISESQSYDERHNTQNGESGSSSGPGIMRRPPTDTQEAACCDDSDGETQLPYASPPQLTQSSLPRTSDELQHPLPRTSDELQHPATVGQAEENPDGEFEPRNSEENKSLNRPYEQDEREVRAAAAREVARELDALSFSPPAISPPENVSHVRELDANHELRASPPPGYAIAPLESPLMPPDPPFAQQGGSPASISNLSLRSDGVHAWSQDAVGASTASFDGLSHQDTITTPSSPIISAQLRSRSTPELEPASPSSSVQKATASSTYTMPTDTSPSLLFSRLSPLRTGSPLGVGARLPPPTGSRTISAAAFKRSQARSPSGGSSTSGQDPRMLDVSPLLLRKKSPSSAPVPGITSNSVSGTGSETGPYQQGPFAADDDEQTYEFVAPQPSSSHYRSSEHGASGGYASGKFSTNLEEEHLR